MLMLCLALIAAQSIDLQNTRLVSSARKPAISQVKTEKALPVVQESINNGQFIRLSDGTLWEIHPGDRKITQSWITPSEIKVVPSNEPTYPFLLTNSITGSSVLARHAASLPQMAPKTTPIPPK
jgi:hypothetical protein